MHAKRAPIHGFICPIPFENPRKMKNEKKMMMKKKGETLNQ
jgi:hypothetical protein